MWGRRCRAPVSGAMSDKAVGTGVRSGPLDRHLRHTAADPIEKKAGPEGPARKHSELCQEETSNELSRFIGIPAFNVRARPQRVGGGRDFLHAQHRRGTGKRR